MPSARADKPTTNVDRQDLLTKTKSSQSDTIREKNQNNVFEAKKENNQGITPKGS